jgi:hypothetical protein
LPVATTNSFNSVILITIAENCQFIENFWNLSSLEYFKQVIGQLVL